MTPAHLTGTWRALLGALLTLLLVSLAAPARAAPIMPTTGGWPLAGSPRVTHGFDPPATRFGAGHRGVDLAARPGDQVLAAAGGRVSFAGLVAGRPVITLDHGGGLSTTYEPARALVPVGTEVAAGEAIGVVSAGSHCTGCLHWGLRQGGTYLDPMLLVGSGDAVGDGSLRLVSKARGGVVHREALARAAAAAAAEAAGIIGGGAPGRPGSHGFAHPVPGGITSGFGRRFHPILKIWKLHDGTDFGASCGTLIRAPYAGRVTLAYANPGYGNRLFLDHGSVDGQHVVTAFNHASRYVVRPGAQVSRGQVIGYVGSTGYATGCHLHLMVWLNGRLVNPMTWF